MAEGILRHHLQISGIKRVKVSSAGTRTSQPGRSPDKRAQRVAAAAGVKLGRIRARRITEQDLVGNDLILAMDRSNMADLQEICPAEHWHKISLLLSYLPEQGPEEVPDPYYGSYEGFEQVFHLIEAAAIGIIPHIGTRE